MSRRALWTYRHAVASVLLWWTTTLAAAPFWTIEGERGTVYLLGSLHFADESFYPLPEPVERAFNNADTLVVEADVTRVDAAALQALLSRGYLPPGETLRDHVSRETWADLQAFLRSQGLSEALLLQQRPALASITLANHMIISQGLRAEQGIDVHFLNRAHARNMPVEELEGTAWQLELLLSLEPAELLLRNSLNGAEHLADNLEILVEAWRTADMAALDDYFIRQPLRHYPELAPVIDQLVFERNHAMAARIREWLDSGGHWFVVVGAGHLAGEQGIPALLGVE